VIITSLILLFIALLSWLYIFNIYEVEIKIDNVNLLSNGNSKTSIELVPLNSIGMRAPLRSINSKISFVIGKELVDVMRDGNNIIVLKSKLDTGTVILRFESDYLLYPNKYEFTIKQPEAS